ncbi:hypothetical protein HK101_005900, partial [Irineochytrium annulatum]
MSMLTATTSIVGSRAPTELAPPAHPTATDFLAAVHTHQQEATLASLLSLSDAMRVNERGEAWRLAVTANLSFPGKEEPQRPARPSVRLRASPMLVTTTKAGKRDRRWTWGTDGETGRKVAKAEKANEAASEAGSNASRKKKVNRGARGASGIDL